MTLAESTPASEVVAVVRWLSTRAVAYQVNGGWAVDALLGHQTRDHGDLDVFVDAAFVPDLLSWLQERGYVTVEDWRPIRIELASATGRVDVHPMTIDAHGDGTQQGFGDETFRHAAADRVTGSIDGAHVVVASPARLRQLRAGYELRPRDRHDLDILARLDADREGEAVAGAAGEPAGRTPRTGACPSLHPHSARRPRHDPNLGPEPVRAADAGG